MMIAVRRVAGASASVLGVLASSRRLLSAARRASFASTTATATATAPREAAKSALVTGGTKGIGRAIVSKFLREGYDVLNVDVDASQFEDLEQEAAAANRRILNIEADVAEEPIAASAVDAAVEAFGGLDVLVNNAGILPVDSFHAVHDYPTELWQRILNVNLNSFFYFSKAALPVMMKKNETTGQCGGTIINLGSVHGLQAASGVAPYAASKGAILAFTRQLALDYGEYGIRVLAVNPGTIMTPNVKRLLDSDGATEEEAGANYPLQHRCGKPEEVANVVHFLASDASFMTGSHVEVDGGISIVGSWE